MTSPTTTQPTETAQRLPTRRPEFDLSSTPRIWIPNRPALTAFVNVLHMLLPAGELWFARIYAKALPLVPDGPLRHDMRGFMRQEAMHARAHDRVLAHLRERGVDTRAFTRFVEWIFEALLGEYSFIARLPLVGATLERWWLRQRITIIAAIEHFTCVLGRFIVEEGGDALEAAGADSPMLALLRWHGAEEVEHRTVAHSLHVELGGGYTTRVFWMIIVSVGLLVLWMLGTRALMRQEPSIPWTRGFVSEWYASAAEGLLPHPRELLVAVIRYLRPDYDPEREATMDRALTFLEPSLTA